MPTTTTQEFLLTVRDVAELLSMSVREVWRLESEGRIPKAIRMSRKTVRWKGTQIEAYLSSLQPASA
jgi:excisionase family DNA binding protein